MELYPYQSETLDRVRDAFRMGYKAPCLVEPTGAGKTVEIMAICRDAAQKGKKILVLTNRKILLAQAAEKLDMGGVDYGIIAAGHQRKILPDIQIASIQSLHSWLKSDKIVLPHADLCIIDEIHSNTAAMAMEIMGRYDMILGVTATPVGLKGVCDCLIQGTTYTKLRELGRLVGVDVYSPTEVSMEGLRQAKGEWSQKAMQQRVVQSGVFGDVLTHFNRLNPFHLPTLVFAPGVKESQHLVEHVFEANGITAAHIDGETPDYERKELFRLHEKGDVAVLSSCGVLKEGFDAPWATHGVLLQVAGRLSTYIQIVGRLLRVCSGKTVSTLQDHTGAWHRHGPPDMDREWSLEDTDQTRKKERVKEVQEGGSEGICCPKCQFVRTAGKSCPQCGHEHIRSVRQIRTVDGTLKKMVGQVVKKKPTPTDERIWTSCLYGSAKANQPLSVAVWKFGQRAGKPFWQADIPQSLRFDKSQRDSKVGEVFSWIK